MSTIAHPPLVLRQKRGVTAVPPVNTDRNDDGAICAQHGRMLSNRNELTISAPSG